MGLNVKNAKLKVNFLKNENLVIQVYFGGVRLAEYFLLVSRLTLMCQRSLDRSFISKRTTLRKFLLIARVLERCGKNGLIN